MKKAFLLLCSVLLLGGLLLPRAGYRLAEAVLSRSAASSEAVPSSAPSEENGLLERFFPAPAAYTGDADVFRIQNLSTGAVEEVEKRAYILGAVAAEMPADWPDEALKAQAIAAHSYALYCRDHAADAAQGWLSADPTRRQGYLTDAVLRSYWGTQYETNYARLSALVDEVLDTVLCYDDAAAGTSYFALSNGQTEASENVWGAPLPYLIAVDSAADRSAPNYEVSLPLSQAQVQTALAGLGLTPDAADPASWFGSPTRTASGYIASLPVCGQTLSGTALRRALGLRSTDFTVSYTDSVFTFTTHGYGHGVGMSQWDAKAMAEQGATAAEILAHYFPGTTLCRSAS